MPKGHQKHKYTESFAVGMGSIRAIKRNQVRKMAAEEKMPLKQAWRLLTGREDLWNPVADMVSSKAAARRRARRKAQRLARKRNR